MLPSFLVASFAAPAVAVPPPPMVVSRSVAPPMMAFDHEPTAPEDLRVKVTTEEGLLWQGTLRVGRTGGSISQDRREAAAARCPEPYTAAIQSNFSIGIGRIFTGANSANPNLTVSVRWTRPVSRDGCPVQGSNSVQLEQRTYLPEGGEVVLHGDAGLTVTVSRR